MRLSQMQALRRTLDDRWASPVPDAAAALWGCAPGTAVDEDQVGGHLRLMPAADRDRADADAAADLMRRLGGVGAVAPVLADAVDALASWVDGLPVGLDRTGLAHGDFELDNLRWDGTTLRSFDYDEAGCGLLLRDVAPALRDLEAHDDLRAAFLAGYGVDVPPAALAVFRAPQSVVTLMHLEGTLDAGGPDDPLDQGEEWLARLHAAVTARRSAERERLLAVASR